MVTALSNKGERSDSATDIRLVPVFVRRRRYSFGWGDLMILDTGLFNNTDDEEEENPVLEASAKLKNKKNVTRK